MESKLKKLIVAYVKADSEIESQKSHLDFLNRVKDGIADELTSRIRAEIGMDEDIYLDYGDGILRCSDYAGDMEYKRIHTIDLDDFKALND